MTTVVKKIGKHLVLVIPDELVKEMQIKEETLLELRAGKGEIVLYRTWGRPRRPISELVKEINPESYRRARREFGA